MSTESTVGRYLVARLEELGLTHVFGVPGDYSMGFLDAVVDSRLKFVGTCNELNGTYAADGYARIHGLGAMVVTYDVGGFSAYNGVAGAYAESVPLVLISGAPTVTQRREHSPMHHLVADYDHQRDMYTRVTVDAVLLDDAETAPALIDRALTRCFQEKKPAYIELPMDMVKAPCARPTTQLHQTPLRSDALALEECIREVVGLLRQAQNPATLVGHEVARFGVHGEMQRLLTRTRHPVAVTLDAVSLVPPTHPAYRGIYRGALGNPEARATIEGADRLLCLGTLRTDISSGNFTASIDRGHLIVARGSSVDVGYHTYPNVRLGDFVPALAEALGEGSGDGEAAVEWTGDDFVIEAARPLTSDRLFQRLRRVIGKGTVVVSDTGDALFQSSALPALDRFITQSYYLSIGYALPAGLGTALAAPEARTWIIIGDGAFQMTAQELSTIVRLRLPVVILLLNNDGYVIERMLHHEAEYNDINRWKYAELARVFGDCRSVRVSTEGELEAELAALASSAGPVFLEAFLERNDCSSALRALATGVGT